MKRAVGHSRSQGQASGLPLQRGPIVGAGYMLAGIAVGVGASAVRGWWATPIWVLAAVLFLAGAWTTLFTGSWLLFFRHAKRRAAARRRASPNESEF